MCPHQNIHHLSLQHDHSYTQENLISVNTLFSLLLTRWAEVLLLVKVHIWNVKLINHKNLHTLLFKMIFFFIIVRTTTRLPALINSVSSSSRNRRSKVTDLLLSQTHFHPHENENGPIQIFPSLSFSFNAALCALYLCVCVSVNENTLLYKYTCVRPAGIPAGRRSHGK